MVHLSSLSYNELASATIDQERMMKVIAEADKKKRKRIMPASAGSGSSSGAPPKYRMVYTPPGGQLRQSPIIPTAAIPAIIAATATIQPCSYTNTTAGCSRATQ
jgi:hypothetical protein